MDADAISQSSDGILDLVLSPINMLDTPGGMESLLILLLFVVIIFAAAGFSYYAVFGG